MEFGWRIIVGSIIGFLGAAFGSVGGVGGGGIFVPMLSLIIGFDAKSSTAISKCNNQLFPSSTAIFRTRSMIQRLRCRYDYGGGRLNSLLQSEAEASNARNANH